MPTRYRALLFTQTAFPYFGLAGVEATCREHGHLIVLGPALSHLVLPVCKVDERPSSTLLKLGFALLDENGVPRQINPLGSGVLSRRLLWSVHPASESPILARPRPGRPYPSGVRRDLTYIPKMEHLRSFIGGGQQFQRRHTGRHPL